jgi:hypothetical protein
MFNIKKITHFINKFAEIFRSTCYKEITSFLILLSLYLAVPFFSSPLLLRFFLVIVSVVRAFTVGLIVAKWFIFVLILVFSGGIIVITVYITNLAPSRKRNRILLKLGLVTLSLFFLPGASFKEVVYPGALLSPLTADLLGFTLGFLLIGLFLIIVVVRKDHGALR